ncbi:MAG: hypothetical protein HEQ16_04965 [Bosea sp.]|nr:hypothetical protein [Bosea sp. (in: a-proteobacteria)]
MSALGRPRSIAGEHALVIFRLRGVTDAPDAIRMGGAALISLTTAGEARRRRISGAGTAAMAMTTTGQAVRTRRSGPGDAALVVTTAASAHRLRRAGSGTVAMIVATTGRSFIRPSWARADSILDFNFRDGRHTLGGA